VVLCGYFKMGYRLGPGINGMEATEDLIASLVPPSQGDLWASSPDE
jgi:hypothetical protein